MTRLEFIAAFNQLPAGAGFAYHVGNLGRDRQVEAKLGRFHVSDVADEALNCYAHGLAILVQRRVEPGITEDGTIQNRCEYIIRKRVSVAAAPRTVNQIRLALKSINSKQEAA